VGQGLGYRVPDKNVCEKLILPGNNWLSKETKSYSAMVDYYTTIMGLQAALVILSGITRQQIFCLRGEEPSSSRGGSQNGCHRMDVFARACCLLENKCKDSKTDEKICRIEHKNPYLANKRKEKKVLFRIQITPSVLLDWVRAQVVSSKKCYLLGSPSIF